MPDYERRGPSNHNSSPSTGQRFYDRERERLLRNNPPRRPAPPPRPTAPPPRRTQPPSNTRPPRLGSGAARKPRRRRSFSLAPGFKKFLLALATIAAVFIIAHNIIGRISAGGVNALSVLINDTHIGYMELDNELTSEDFHQLAVTHIETNLRTTILLNETITVAAATWIPQRDINTREYMLRAISQNVTYQIVARAIYVNGNLEAIVRSLDCVDEIIRFKVEPWRNSNTVEYTIATDWHVAPLIVDPLETTLLSALDAAEHMDRSVLVNRSYIVQPGDTLGAIALRHDTRVDIIARASNISIDIPLRIGQVLMIPSQSPLLSVRTVDEYFSLETIYMEIETHESPYIAVSAVEIVQQGQNGEQRIVRRVVSIDGIVVDEYVLEAEIISYPVTHIIYVGTRERR